MTELEDIDFLTHLFKKLDIPYEFDRSGGTEPATTYKVIIKVV